MAMKKNIYIVKHENENCRHPEQFVTHSKTRKRSNREEIYQRMVQPQKIQTTDGETKK